MSSEMDSQVKEQMSLHLEELEDKDVYGGTRCMHFMPPG